MDKVLTNGLIIQLIKACGNSISSMVTVNISGAMEESTKVNGKKIWCMAVENFIMKMVAFIRANSKTILNMARVLTNGQTERFTKVVGLMVSSMEKADSLILKE